MFLCFFFFFLIFSYLIIQSLPQPCMELFLVSYSFLVFCGSKSYLSRCKPCSTAAKGPRSQVPSYLQLIFISTDYRTLRIPKSWGWGSILRLPCPEDFKRNTCRCFNVVLCKVLPLPLKLLSYKKMSYIENIAFCQIAKIVPLEGVGSLRVLGTAQFL